VQRVETYDGGDATEPRVATDPQGRATAVWTQASATVPSIWSSRLANSGWGAAIEIDGNDARGARMPQLTVSDNGDAVALWQRASQTIGYTANLFRNGAWGTPQTLFESAPSSAFFGPALAGSRNGAALMAWASTAGRGSSLAASTLSGTTWTTRGLPLGATTSFPTLGNVRDANGPNGEGALLWSQSDQTGLKLWINQFRNAQWGTPLQVDAGAADSFGEAGIAAVSGPAEVVVWKATQAIWANKHTSTWTGAVKIRDLPAGATVSNVQVVSDSRSNAAFAVWLENNRVWASAFNGSTWAPAVNIEAVTTGNAAAPSIALEPSGIAVAVWSHTAARSDIWANRYAPGSGWGKAVRIENDDAGDATAPSIAVDSRGNAQAVWQQSDGTRVNVVSNHLD
jgi:hypothetical protein